MASWSNLNAGTAIPLWTLGPLVSGNVLPAKKVPRIHRLIWLLNVGCAAKFSSPIDLSVEKIRRHLLLGRLVSFGAQLVMTQ